MFFYENSKICEKSRKNHGGMLAKLLLSNALIAPSYQTLYYSIAISQDFYHMVLGANNLIYIFINIYGKH